MTALFWSLLGLVAILSEFVIPEFVMFFVGVGALATAGLVAFFPPIGGSIPLQVLSWLGFTVLSLVALRRHFKSAFGGTIFSRKQRESAVTGKHAEVVEEIAPETPGRVRFQGTTWRAVSYNEALLPGVHVEILEQKGMTLIVTKSILGGLEDDSMSEDSDSKGGAFADESEREWE